MQWIGGQRGAVNCPLVVQSGAMSEDTVIEISNVWKIFGSEPMAALQAIRERGLSKAEVLEEFNARSRDFMLKHDG